MPEMSLSTPTRTTPPEISARATLDATHDRASARPTLRPFIISSSICPRLRGRRFIVSNLPVRQAQHETVELCCQLDLAGQPAVRAALGGRTIKQRIFLVGHRRPPREPGFVDISVAGGAHGVAAAFGDDAIEAVLRGSQHGAFAVAGLDAFAGAVGKDEGDDRHVLVRQTGVMVMGRFSSPRSVLL